MRSFFPTVDTVRKETNSVH